MKIDVEAEDQLTVKNRVPQSSTIPTQQVDPKLFEIPQTPPMLRSNANLRVSQSNEFRGPLITKEGVLYDDEDYNVTYKAKLRLNEIDMIREYLKQVHEKGGKVIYEEDETFVDENLI
jgi:hypothetical protein